MDYAQQLAFFANILEQKRLMTALEGNASIIDRETGLTYITPSGRMKLLLQREDISVMDESGSQIGGRGKRSSEYLLHEAVYRTRPDINAVVHCHCPYLTAYALRYQDFIVPENCSLHHADRCGDYDAEHQPADDLDYAGDSAGQRVTDQHCRQKVAKILPHATGLSGTH